jgi:hypothetical protein
MLYGRFAPYVDKILKLPKLERHTQKGGELDKSNSSSHQFFVR